MPRPRKRLVSLADTPYYHCISRCVRRAYLCGQDSVTGYNFEHRRQWIVDRLTLLVEVFAIDVCAYAIMSNHFHVVLHVDEQRAKALSNREVARRWLRIFAGPPQVRTWLEGRMLCAAERSLVDQWLDKTRHRLFNISWFMRCLNEPIARLANAEDGCTGRFWEGRFKSQALLDEKALLTCMAYVDLNPIRAGMATTPEASDFTSVQQRVVQQIPPSLMPFSGQQPQQHSAALPYCAKDYLQLVDWAGRCIVPGKRGHIPAAAPPIASRLNIGAEVLLDYLKSKPDKSVHAVGPVNQLRALAASFDLKFIRGIGLAKKYFPSTA